MEVLRKYKKRSIVVVLILLSIVGFMLKLPRVFHHYDKNHITNFNKMIRKICESLNMKDEIKFYREIAGQTIKVTKYKFEEVSSHTCRRTFCTLKFLKGMPAQAIMKFTGHTGKNAHTDHPRSV